MKNLLTLYDLVPKDSARIKEIFCNENLRRRLADIGLTPGTDISCVGESPSKDPKAFLIRGAVIAIRKEDALKIQIAKKESAHERHQTHCHRR